VIETDEQRRWWFATHPEFSWSRKGARNRGEKKEEEENKGIGNVSPEEVDEYVDKALTRLTGPIAEFLEAVKRLFGTESEPADKQQRSEDGLAKEAFIGQLVEAGWSRQQAERKWEAFKLNESIGRTTASAMGIRSTLAGARTILTSAYRWGFADEEKSGAGKKGPRLPAKGTPERKEIEAARTRGINAKKAEELKDIQEGGKGSGVWSKEELAEIRRTGEFPPDAQWHHNPTVANRPDLAADPRSVRPLRGGTKGHLLDGHDGNWQNPKK
jgi:hypothetical protein